MTNVEVITTEAIAAFVAWLSLTAARISGSNPTNERALNLLLQSGWASHVESRSPTTDESHGWIREKRGKQVDEEIAQELVHRVTAGLFGEPSPSKGSYSTIIECMGNTHEHARKGRRREHWWATAYYDKSEGRGFFTVVDLGVGIFHSERLKPFRRRFLQLGGSNNAHLLKEMLAGQISSRTGLSYRGKGLPWIDRHLREGRIRKLYVVSNDVFANVEDGRFESLTPSFNGTLLHWELGGPMYGAAAT